MMLKKIGILCLVLTCCLLMSAAEVNSYYRVTTGTLNGRSFPDKTGVKVKQYTKQDVLYITNISMDRKWGYVSEDNAWVYLSYIQQLSIEEEMAYRAYLKREEPTKESAEEDTFFSDKSILMRILKWVLICLAVIGPVFLLKADDPIRSIGIYYTITLLCIVLMVVWTCSQLLLSWGLKIVSLIDYYILGGWLLDSVCNGILAIIPFILDLPTYGLYGLFVGLLPSLVFYAIWGVYEYIGIDYLFEDYPLAKWIIYVFQIVMFLLVVVVYNDNIYQIFNQFLQLDSVPAMAFMTKACNWGQYANDVFITAFYIGTLALLIPRDLAKKILDKLNFSI